MTEKKPTYIIEVEYTIDFDRLIVRDVSHFHERWFIERESDRFGQLFKFDGNKAFIMVCDPFNHLTREIALKAAFAFIEGKLEVYQYND